SRIVRAGSGWWSRRVPSTTTLPAVVTCAPSASAHVSPAGTVNPSGKCSPSSSTRSTAAVASASPVVGAGGAGGSWWWWPVVVGRFPRPAASSPPRLQAASRAAAAPPASSARRVMSTGPSPPRRRGPCPRPVVRSPRCGSIIAPPLVPPWPGRGSPGRRAWYGSPPHLARSGRRAGRRRPRRRGERLGLPPGRQLGDGPRRVGTPPVPGLVEGRGALEHHRRRGAGRVPDGGHLLRPEEPVGRRPAQLVVVLHLDPPPVGADDDVERLVHRVEADGGAAQRLLHVDVPPPEVVERPPPAEHDREPGTGRHDVEGRPVAPAVGGQADLVADRPGDPPDGVRGGEDAGARRHVEDGAVGPVLDDDHRRDRPEPAAAVLADDHGGAGRPPAHGAQSQTRQGAPASHSSSRRFLSR